ncbi:MAG: glycosyl transferase family 1 [Bacteroidota bacterium]|jgi:glycosyltransferase involved in cell wall biosynthesis|nr:glycosyl transferase family 1 [Bacteroidota bacterium]
MEKKKIVFLYTEIAEYFLAGCRALVDNNVELHVVRYPVNKEAPFQFEFPENISFYEKGSIENLSTFISGISPDAIICSGWVDKDYKKICKLYRKRIPVVLIIDNQWKGSYKQYLLKLLSPFVIGNSYTHAFVPGILQYQYARKLGFAKGNILSGFYTADVDYFRSLYEVNRPRKSTDFPKKFLYVGRYYGFKGITDLWQAFIEMQNEMPNEWELWCLGTGDVKPIEHSKIRHFGFVQPKQLANFIGQTGVFVLPSHFEPWGVVVHEFAASGFPIICSDEVGARTAFVEDNVNGFVFASSDVDDLKRVLKTVVSMNDRELIKMADKSSQKALDITPKKWAGTIMKLFQK